MITRGLFGRAILRRLRSFRAFSSEADERKQMDQDDAMKRLTELIKTHGDVGVCPSYAQIDEWEDGDKTLTRDIRRTGGIMRFARTLGLETRRSVPRNRYWKSFDDFSEQIMDVARLISSASDDADDGEKKLMMPTTAQLRAHDKTLLYGLTVHGGVKHVSEQLGLDLCSNSTSSKYDTFADLRDAIGDIDVVVQRGVMPTQIDLQTMGRYDLVTAINKYGGFREVARVLRLKMQRRPRKKQLRGENGKILSDRVLYRNWDDLEREMRWFVEREGMTDEQGDESETLMPTLRQLHDAGRDDIRLSISWFHGGVRAVRDRLGWKKQPRMERL